MTQMVDEYKIFLEANSVQIPCFIGKLISNMAVIRRSNGDVYHYSIGGIVTLAEMKEHFKRVYKVLLSIDFVSEIPALAGRFRNNEVLNDIVSKLFTRLMDSSSFAALGDIIIEQFNFVSKSSSNITSISANQLFDWVVTTFQDSRIYGMRNYRKGVDPNSVIFRSDIEFNQLFCFMSILFVSSVHVRREAGTQILTHESMNDDVVNIDTESNSSNIVFLSYVLSYLNESRSTDRPTFVGKRSPIRKETGLSGIIKNGATPLSSGLSGNGTAPSGGRGYSSIRTSIPKTISLNLITKKGVNLVINFSSVKELNDFIDSRPSLVGKLE